LYLALVRFVMFNPSIALLSFRSRAADFLKEQEGQGHRFTGVRGQLRGAPAKGARPSGQVRT
jgi:hypothetical protein